MEREDPAAVSDPASGAGSQPGGAEAGCLELEMKKKKMARIHHPAASAKSFPPKASAPLVTLGRREKKKRGGVFLKQLQLSWSPVAEGR